MSAFKNILDPNEQVIWSGKPDKKAFMLPAFGGIFIALFFFGNHINISKCWSALSRVSSSINYSSCYRTHNSSTIMAIQKDASLSVYDNKPTTDNQIRNN